MKEKNSDKVCKPCLRRVMYSGGSFLISIPKAFIDHYGLKAGDRVAIIPGSILQIVPVKE